MSYTSEQESYNDNYYDGSYSLIIPFPFMVLDNGEMLVGHFIQCDSCKIIYQAYVNMTNVKDDILSHGICCMCQATVLNVVTYKLIHNL